MDGNRRIVAYLDNLERHRFFTRLAEATSSESLGYVFITNRLYIYLKGRLLGQKIYLLKRRRSAVRMVRDLEQGLDVLSQSLSLYQSEMLYYSVVDSLKSISRRFQIAGCFIWNGERTPGIAVSDFCVEEGIPVLFFEVANFPGKIFVDKLGVNAKSSIFRDISILNEYEVPMIEFDGWRDRYLSQKSVAHNVPQARVNRKRYWSYMVDVIGYNLLAVPVAEENSLRKELRQKLNLRRKASAIYYDVPSRHEQFVFYPMQVSTDSQLLINSDMDNFQAIRCAALIAQERKCKLYVKLHPSEVTGKVVIQTIELRSELGFKLVQEDTFSLLKRAQLVVTVNSTVGMEARILGTPVKYLGRSYVEKLSYRELGYLILKYFVDIDYFSSKPIDVDQGQVILKRLLNFPIHSMDRK